MYKDTITVFNRYSSELGEIWYPHVIKDVHLIKDRASIREKYGSDSSDSAALSIRYQMIDDKMLIGDIQYKPPKEWARQVNEELPASLTFNDNGELFDFFVEGDVLEELDQENGMILDSQYKNGFYNYMNKKHDFCYAITSVGTYQLIPHFEILGK